MQPGRPVSPGAPTASRICCWCSQRSVYSRPMSNQFGEHVLSGPGDREERRGMGIEGLKESMDLARQ